MSVPDIFGRPLSVDPAVALRPIPVKPRVDGPAHWAQFVVELVGPRTIPAQAAKIALDPRWQAALGEPQVFVMAAADTQWRALEIGDQAGAYDSLALAWDYVTDRGSLTSQAAQNLLGVAEQLALPLGRRAMPLPPPEDVDAAVKAVLQASQNLDAGVGLAILPRGLPFAEKDVWIACAELGLAVGPSGLFDWTVPEWPEPLLSVASLGDRETFSLQAVTSAVNHPGLSAGFRLAHSPNAEAVFDGCVKVAKHLAARLGGAVFDEEDRLLTEAVQTELAGFLTQAVSTLRSVRLEPGSPAALRVFK